MRRWMPITAVILSVANLAGLGLVIWQIGKLPSAAWADGISDRLTEMEDRQNDASQRTFALESQIAELEQRSRRAESTRSSDQLSANLDQALLSNAIDRAANQAALDAAIARGDAAIESQRRARAQEPSMADVVWRGY